MSTAIGSRQAILERIGAVTRGIASRTAYEALPRGYVRSGKLASDARLALMRERLEEYDAEVAEATPAGLPAAIAQLLAASGRKVFLAPPDLPKEWLAAGYAWKVDNGLATADIEAADGVVTAATCGVAESGTIVLHHSGLEGRRVLTLLPDWHLCVLRGNPGGGDASRVL